MHWSWMQSQQNRHYHFDNNDFRAAVLCDDDNLMGFSFSCTFSSSLLWNKQDWLQVWRWPTEFQRSLVPLLSCFAAIVFKRLCVDILYRMWGWRQFPYCFLYAMQGVKDDGPESCYCYKSATTIVITLSQIIIIIAIRITIIKPFIFSNNVNSLYYYVNKHNMPLLPKVWPDSSFFKNRKKRNWCLDIGIPTHNLYVTLHYFQLFI